MLTSLFDFYHLFEPKQPFQVTQMSISVVPTDTHADTACRENDWLWGHSTQQP